MNDNDIDIAIIGAGNVGSALGRTLLTAGYPVTYGVVGDDGEARARARVDPRARIRPAPEAAAAARLIVLAVPGLVAVQAVADLGPLPGKVLVDCTNPLRWKEDGPIWQPPEQGSNAEAIAAHFPGLAVVKAFNTFGAAFHDNPSIDGEPVDVPICGDDVEAKALVSGVASRAGFRPLDAGPLRNAAPLENLAMLWIHLAVTEKRGLEVVFQLRQRSS